MLQVSEIVQKVQAAGQAVFEAAQSVELERNEMAEKVRIGLLENPFDVRNDEAFEDWKSISRLKAGLADIETGLKNIYADLERISSAKRTPARNIKALPAPAKAKSSSAKKRAVKIGPGNSEVLIPASSTATTGKLEKSGVVDVKAKKQGKVKGNTKILLDALKGQLNDVSFIKLNRSVLAKDIGMAIGSIGASIVKLKSVGILEEDDKKGLKFTSKK